MKAYAKVFESTFDPSCCDADIPSAPGVERLNVLIFGLKNSTLIPYVLYVRKNVESPDEQAKFFATLESYIVRRMLVRATTKNYKRLSTSLILNEVKDAVALRAALAADAEATTYMPSDAEVRAAFGESCLYNLQSKGVLYLLESAIRPSMSSTALLGFSQYTLEHMTHAHGGPHLNFGIGELGDDVLLPVHASPGGHLVYELVLLGRALDPDRGGPSLASQLQGVVDALRSSNARWATGPPPSSPALHRKRRHGPGNCSRCSKSRLKAKRKVGWTVKAMLV